MVLICTTCGCHIPGHPHLDEDPDGANITIQDLRRAANSNAAGGISVRQAVRNMIDTLEIADLAIEAFVNGFSLYHDEMSVRSESALVSLLEIPKRYMALVDGSVKAINIQAAGLLVQARDSGRVLLIQRSLADEDKEAAGMLELPGGRLDEGEDAWTAACREFCEEVGVPLPSGQLIDTWVADNAVYQGFLYAIATEDLLDLHPDDDVRQYNPDDPDGDYIETVIWVDPAHLMLMPLRRELRAMTPWRQLLDIPAENELPNPFELLEAAGAKYGLLDKLYIRRDRIWMRYDKRSREWARKLSHVVPKDRLALSVRQAYDLSTPSSHEVAEDLSQQTQDQRKAVFAAALAMLRHVLQEFRAMESEGEQLAYQALSEASAEGTAAAVATLAQQMGKDLPNLDELKAQQLANIQSLGTMWAGASDVMKEQINGLAGDIAITATAAIASGSDLHDVEDLMQRIIANGDGAAFYIDQAIHQAYAQAAVQWWLGRGVQQVRWVTAGDERVCAVCEALEAGGPYDINEAPIPPEHGACRCVLVAE